MLKAQTAHWICKLILYCVKWNPPSLAELSFTNLLKGDQDFDRNRDHFHGGGHKTSGTRHTSQAESRYAVVLRGSLRVDPQRLSFPYLLLRRKEVYKSLEIWNEIIGNRHKLKWIVKMTWVGFETTTSRLVIQCAITASIGPSTSHVNHTNRPPTQSLQKFILK